jgi:hypothetical protein
MLSGLPTGWAARAAEDTLCYRLAADDVVPLLALPSGLRFVARSLVDKVALRLMDDHARHCVIDGPAELKEERTEELMAAVGRLMRRG